MMFVSGETAEPSVETTTLIEEIVRQQVVEIVCLPLCKPLYNATDLSVARPQHAASDSSWSPLHFN